jgi:hypothetical protein
MRLLRYGLGLGVLLVAAVASSRAAALPEPLPAPPSAAGAAPLVALDDNVGLLDPPALVAAPAARLVVIGDVHGDLAAFRQALHLAGAIDAATPGCVWTGGALAVVQTGDQLDRGPDEEAVLACAEALRAAAPRAGGLFVSLIGNHEVMNALGDFAYADPASRVVAPAAGNATAAAARRAELAGVPPALRARAAALLPGGAWARVLATRPVVARVGDTLVVHGGLLPAHAAFGLARLNALTRAWFAGALPTGADDAAVGALLAAPDSPLWTRRYALHVDAAACAELAATLRALGAARLVVGHTPQAGGITAACGGLVWRVDVGLAAAFHPVFPAAAATAVQVLEVTAARGAAVLTAGPTPAAAKTHPLA